jgi:hypothetical protein
MIVKFNFRRHWLNWLCCLASLAEGLIGTITLGFLVPDWSFLANRKYLNYMDKYHYKQNKGKM